MTIRRLSIHALLFLVITAGFGQAQSPSIVMARLTAPISTKTSAVNDRLSAIIDEPEQYRGGVIEGRITGLTAPQRGMGKGKPDITFQFDSLTLNGSTAPISAELRDFANSKGVSHVDEEGRVVGQTSNKKRALWTGLGAGAGAAIGGAAGGGKGAATGAGIGGAAALALSLKMTTTGSNIEFFPGSLMTLQVTKQKP